MQRRVLALVLLLSTSVQAKPVPAPKDAIDHVENSRECEDDSKENTCTYVIDFEITETFAKAPLARQTKVIEGLIKWWVESWPKDKPTAFRFEAGLNHRQIGFSDGNAWIWADWYVAAINARAIR